MTSGYNAFVILYVAEENLKVWNGLALPSVVTMKEKIEVCYLTTLLIAEIIQRQ
jgi:hypothetical protein